MIGTAELNLHVLLLHKIKRKMASYEIQNKIITTMKDFIYFCKRSSKEVQNIKKIFMFIF